jgi:GGDEF domain-containing protein
VLLLLVFSASRCLAMHYGDLELSYHSTLTDENTSLTEVIDMPESHWKVIPDGIHSASLFEHASSSSGTAPKTLWVRVHLPRRSDFKKVWLEFGPNVGLDGRIAQYTNSRWIWSQPEGLESKLDTRQPVNLLTFELDLESEKRYAFLKLNSSLAFHFKINTLTQNELLWHAVSNNLFNGFLLGFFFLAIVYNFAIGISAGERIYLYYAFYVGCNAVYISIISGYLRLVFPEWGSIGNMGNLGAVLVLFSGTVFVRDLLSTATYTPRIDRLLQIMQTTLFLSLLFITFLPDTLALLLVLVIGTIGPSLVIAAGIICYRKRHPYAGYFLLAWSLFVISIMIWIAMWSGFLPPNIFVTNVFKVGAMLEITLLSLILAYRYSYLKDKTLALRKSQSSLRTLSETDDLTGVLNRRGFIKYAEELVNLRTAERVWLIMDIDHFKSFNDRHGHQAGDQLLSNFGHILNNMQRREDLTAKLLSTNISPNDRRVIAGRIGGEEFVMLFTDCSLVQGKRYAEKLIEEFRQAKVPGLNGELSGSTLSIGATQIRPEDTLETVWKRADKLLYQAKQKGRNQLDTD